MKPESRRLITLAEAERLTGRKISSWRKDILQRRIPYIKLRRSIRLQIEVVEELIRKGYRPPVAAFDEPEK